MQQQDLHAAWTTREYFSLRNKPHSIGVSPKLRQGLDRHRLVGAHTPLL